MHRLLVFSDLDGSLLDHDTYDFAPAVPAIAAIKAQGGLLILASSKTASEMRPLHQALDLGAAPMIVENGAACVSTTGVTTKDADYRAIRQVLQTLHAPFRGFGDMSALEIQRLTGLSLEEAQRAKARQFSEPGLWQGDARQRAGFLAALARRGISARQGGRFMTLSFGATKACQMETVKQSYAPCVTIALGDAPNDIEMIANADHGVVIRNDHSPDIPPFANEEHILRTRRPGPEGWCDAVMQILEQQDQGIRPRAGTRHQDQEGTAPHG